MQATPIPPRVQGKKLRCAIYTRVSTDNQAEKEFNSCEAQEARIKSFINSQENMEVFKIYSDPGFTGANLNRPALNEVLNDIKQNKINLVISYKIDRLTRSPKDFYQLIELFEKHGVDFISVTERFDTSTPSGRLLRNIMLTFAQFERELASERTRDKMLQRAQKGMWNGGSVPFGYKAENRKLIIDEKGAKIVRNIYESYIASGSLFEVYDELKVKGIRDKKGLNFAKSGIYSILRNPVYTGKTKYAGKLSQGLHQPIISEEVFSLAQEIHQTKKQTMLVYRNYPLAGLVKCRECNTHMTLTHTNKMKRGKTKKYYYYRCTKTLKRDWNECGTKHVSAPRLDGYVFQNLERISLDRQYIESLMFRLNNSPSGDHRGFPDITSGQAPFSLQSPTDTASVGYQKGYEQINSFPKLSGDIFQQTLQYFIEGIKQRKGIDKNLWAKKFIKNILYSKSDIQINLYYSTSFENLNPSDFLGWHKTSRVKTFDAFSPDDSVSSVRNKKDGCILDRNQVKQILLAKH
ncbi:MAG: recombinase family protein [Nitrospirae bacterium]|nr:recombinase family protein [Nitrospirota bacterium]